MKVKIVKELKRSDGLWHFACGDVFRIVWVLADWRTIYAKNKNNEQKKLRSLLVYSKYLNIISNFALFSMYGQALATHPDEMPGERYVGNPSCHFESDAEVKLARHWTISQTAATILTSFDSDSLHPTLVLSTNLTSFSVVNKHLKFATTKNNDQLEAILISQLCKCLESKLWSKT